MHNFKIVKKSIELAGKTFTIETGKMAKQANGSVFMTYGDTAVLVTATASKTAPEGIDFFPLTVDFNEKMYATGKIPGGFFKREAKPSTDATLSSRVIDRSIRPLFPDGFRNSVHVVITPLSYDGEIDLGTLGCIGASAALSISDIPFNGPIAGVNVGIIDDKMQLFPKLSEIADSVLDLAVAGTESSVVMIESGAFEISEEKILEAVYFGHEEVKRIIELQKDLIKEVGKDKMEIELDLIPEDILKKIETDFGIDIKKAAHIIGKLEREDAFDLIKENMNEKYVAEYSEEDFITNERFFKNGLKQVIKNSVRYAILHDNHRVDGRKLDDIRDITCEIDVIPRVHGSALFTRGETQSLGTVTLGTASDEQIIDGLKEEYKKRFYLHYNFPPFSVGEAGFMRAPGRRELGHGALAERSLIPVMPGKEDFPYTVRVVSDILESNGSSSMATVCSGSLSLMAAGVPISAPVAGIANGLIMEGDKWVVLTDIMGLEDHLGDMDFKVAGTRKGITSMQMDIKIEGITKEIMTIALAKAKIARLYLLGKIEDTISEPRVQTSDFAPSIETFKVPVTKIGEIIGSAGKVIKSIIEETKVDINIEDDGKVSVASTNKDNIAKAKKIIMSIIYDPVRNKIYEGVVFRIEKFGAFVKFMNGFKEGLVHISNISHKRIRFVEDVVKKDDKVKVQFISIEKGKIQLSMKGIEGNPDVDDSYSGGNSDHSHGDRKPNYNKRHDSGKSHYRNNRQNNNN